jgi:subtilisin family serine protease
VDPLDLVRLTPLMDRSSGAPETEIGLLDGPIAVNNPELTTENISEAFGGPRRGCAQTSSPACLHGTFTAGVLNAKRDSPAPGICPDCTLLVRPIFEETTREIGAAPSVSASELGAAVLDCVEAGARVLNLSVAFAQPSFGSERELEEALNHAVIRGTIVVAAAGNQGTVVGFAITRHPGVIPVAACDLQGKPTRQTNLGGSIGRRGLLAPGEGITSLGAENEPLSGGGTSVAAPFVTGAIALLWSIFPTATASEVKHAVTGSYRRRTAVVPPLLDAWAAYRAMARIRQGEREPIRVMFAPDLNMLAEDATQDANALQAVEEKAGRS